MIVSLPWPPKGLSPNARLHWAQQAKLKSVARQSADWFAKAAMPLPVRQHIGGGDAPIPLKVTFYPPDRRRRDDDNMVASFKSYRDGLADALGVDDRRFRPSYEFAEPEQPGKVEVRIG